MKLDLDFDFKGKIIDPLGKALVDGINKGLSFDFKGKIFDPITKWFTNTFNNIKDAGEPILYYLKVVGIVFLSILAIIIIIKFFKLFELLGKTFKFIGKGLIIFLKKLKRIPLKDCCKRRPKPKRQKPQISTISEQTGEDFRTVKLNPIFSNLP
ncbi:hypothetical protein [Landjia virus]|uniref:Uncharacterized protein n=1 Tax=Landjia virus TaxID=1272947 RepID=A0A0D3R1U5_9RHAB|nr:hypothetical protein [Landjia virus]AJR28487.1 hypothetical protein [Landjia virus]